MRHTLLTTVLAMLAALVLAGCGGPPPPAHPGEVTRLAAAIRALGPEVDPDEARRAARVAYRHTATLAREYEITDPPLIHNTKVNMGLKPAGLCWHWARDIETRLKEEQFRTLEMHRAIANAENVFRLEHSTAIISARGDAYDAGIVLDPWRKGGQLTWVPVAEDPLYDWEPRDAVTARKLEREHGQIVTITEDRRFLVGGTEYAARDAQ
ncbi:hypothetical protein ACROSR_15410 [Roseovarius tibetensis]|uniref:hypothetical protein n=1 Tax=Roseovarius tibetensis TaxID=2685897 RepID=UPI003D7F2FD9